MINSIRLKDSISGKIEIIVGILESLGYDRITVHNYKELRFPRIGGSNPTSMSFDLSSLKYYCFSTNDHGDIFSLVMNNLGYSFGEALKYVALKSGTDISEISAPKFLPFGGFYKYVEKETLLPEEEMETIDSDILKNFKNLPNLMFLRDGIMPESQMFFGDGYDPISNRITIPEYTLEGNLCGIMGRLNDYDCEKDERWLPIIPCQRSYTLYGFHFNYSYIQQKQTVIIGESEKFVQQLYSMGYRNALALCGCSISPVQARYIKSLMCKKIVLALDEGLEEEQIRQQADKLKYIGDIWHSQIGYIYDRDHEVLTEGKKEAPSDKGKDALKELCKNHIVWVN